MPILEYIKQYELDFSRIQGDLRVSGINTRFALCLKRNGRRIDNAAQRAIVSARRNSITP